MGDVTAFVSLASERYRRQVGRVGLKQDALQRYLPDSLCDPSLLISEYSSYSDVPVSEPRYLIEAFYASAICVENPSEVQASAFLQDVYYHSGGFPRVDYDRQRKAVGDFQLSAECFFLLLHEFLGPVAVHADFSDRPYLSPHMVLHLFHLRLPAGIYRGRMQPEAREQYSFMSVGKSEHRISRLRVDVRKNHLRDSCFQSPGYRCVFLAGKCLVIKVGVCVCKCLHILQIYINFGLMLHL